MATTIATYAKQTPVPGSTGTIDYEALQKAIDVLATKKPTIP
jgi:hypothetical protein